VGEPTTAISPELARLAPDELIGEVTSGANLFGFVGSVCGPLM